MSLRKSISVAALSSFACCFMVNEAGAQGNFPTLNGTNLQSGLIATLKTEEVLASRTIQRGYVNFGTNEYVFVMPPGFRMDASNLEKIVLIKSDNSCFLSFRVKEPGAIVATELKPDAYRSEVLNRYPNARILDEFTQYAAGHSGPAFDLEWKNTVGVVQFTRVTFIPSPAGILEFNLSVPSEKNTDGLYVFNGILLTFRSNEGGKLRIPIISDQF